MGNKVNKINYSMKNETSKKYCGKMWLFWMNDSWSIVIKVSDVFITQYFSTPQKDGVTVSLKVAEIAVFSFLFLPRSSLFSSSLPSRSSLLFFSAAFSSLSLSLLWFILCYFYSPSCLSLISIHFILSISPFILSLYSPLLCFLYLLYIYLLSPCLSFFSSFLPLTVRLTCCGLLYNSNNTASSTIL